MGPRTLEIDIIPVSDKTVDKTIWEGARERESEWEHERVKETETETEPERQDEWICHPEKLYWFCHRFHASLGIMRSMQLGSVLLFSGGKKSERKESTATSRNHATNL